MRKRYFAATAVGVALTTLMGPYILLNKVPELQSLKKTWFPSFSLQEQYKSPIAAEERNIDPIQKAELPNKRTELEQIIAELFITRSNNTGEYTPGGVLLRKGETRKGHLFGEFSSYDPRRTQRSVEKILSRAEKEEQRVLIYDEGEGGYVLRTGVMPPAQEIGDYLTEGIVGPNIGQIITPNESKKERANQIGTLFNSYAKELSDRGIDSVFGPVLDVASKDSEGNLINEMQRNFSDRHLVTREIAKTYITAMHNHGIRVVGKHFLTAGLTEEGDIHDETVANTDTIRPKLWAGQTYRLLREDLDAIMVTHVGNPCGEDKGRPYSISPRAIEYLTRERYNNNQFRGINFQGLVIVDDISMQGLISYVQEGKLTEKELNLISDTENLEAKAAILALNAGAHVLIANEADTDEVIEAVADVARRDNNFLQKVINAERKYEAYIEQ
ncbi:hypothetical protein HOC80_02175 [archaeon]|jgi:beta-glucosidase-like glycosyl hydrolase|nr:hypothetical protein [archaeon]MBT4416888.1 hypothetical protein [archaeon]